MDPRRQRIRLGLFVMTAMVLLAVLIFMFGSGVGARFISPGSVYYIELQDAPGVSVGTPVRKSGVKIGEVTKVELDDNSGLVHITIRVQPKYTIRRSDEAVINQDLLSRDTTIDLVPTPQTPALAPPVPLSPSKDDIKKVSWSGPGDDPVSANQPPLGKEPQPRPPVPQPPPLVVPQGEPLPPGSVIRGRPPSSASGLLGEAGNILPTAEATLIAIRRSAERIEQAVPQLVAGFREFTELGRGLRAVVPEVRQTNDELRQLIQSARQATPNLRRTNEELQVTLRNFGTVAERVDNLIQANQDKLVRGLDQATDVLQRMSQLLSDENQKNVTATLRAFQTASANFDSVVRNTDEFVKEGTKTARRFQDTMTQFDQVLANLNQATRPLAERGDRILRNLDASFEQIARVVGGLGEMMTPLGQGPGTVQKFFTDPSLYNNLNAAATMVTKTLPRLDFILRDLEVFADKIARHPESIGLGGAVRPSAGLKDGPSGNGPPRR